VLIPTFALPVKDELFAGLYTPVKGCSEVPLTNSMPNEPLTPFCGAKKDTTPEFPAGHATSSLGPMMVRLLSASGLVSTTWLALWQSE